MKTKHPYLSLIKPLGTLCAALLFSAGSAAAAVNINLTPTPDPFPAIPAVTDWSTLTVGTATDTAITNAAQFDAKIIAAADAAAITTILGSSGTFNATTGPSSNPIARWNTGAQTTPVGITFLQTRPTTNDYLLLLATLTNATGGDVNQITVAYDYSKFAESGAATETIKGLRAYASVSGAPGSWQPITLLSTDTTGTAAVPQAISAEVPLPSTLASGGTMYLLWADQNSTGTDASYHIDNFAVTKSNRAILTPTVTNIVRHPGASPTDISDDTISFNVRVDVFNPPAGTPGWTTTGLIPPTPLTGPYATVIPVTGVPVSVVPFTVGLADQLDPLSTASFSITSASLPKNTALNLISGTPAYVLADPASAAQWAVNGQTMSFTQGNGGGIVAFAAATTPVTFAAGSPKFVTLTMTAQDTSTGTNFETEDILKIELVTDAGTQVLTGLQDKNGTGFVNGFSDVGGSYDLNPMMDEFNRDGILRAGTFNNTWRLDSIIPASATSAQVVITGLNNAVTEFFTVQNIVFGVAVDSDNDGAYDSQETTAGTDPHNASSVFRLITQGCSGGVYSITVPTVSTRLYQLDTSSDLVIWTPQALPVAGTDANMTFTTPCDVNRKYARITLQ